MRYIYTMEYSSAIRKNEIMPFAATWMDLEKIILSRVSQKDKDKCYMISLVCESKIWYKWTYLQKRLTEREQSCGYQGGGGWGWNGLGVWDQQMQTGIYKMDR